MNDTSEQLLPPAPLTTIPREITLRASRRSWNELPVRIWVILALAVALITTFFSVTKYLAGRYERWLIAEGAPLKADVMWINGTQDKRMEFKRTDRLQAQLGYTPPAGQRLNFVPGWLAQLPDQKPEPVIHVGDQVPIRVDPGNPTVWTDRTQPKPWLVDFTIVMLLLPLLVLLGLLALFRRMRVLNIWRKGEIGAGVVVDLKQTAIAPLSRVVRFTLADGSDRRVFSTLHPAKEAPKPGDLMWLLFPPGKPARAIVASLYQ